MKFFFAFLCILFITVVLPLGAQEGASLDWDIEAIFDEPPKEEEKKQAPAPASAVGGLVKKNGYVFDAAFQFIGGIIPGWDNAPWNFDAGKDYSTNPSVKMKATFGLDAQISEVFRVKSTVYFEIPNESSTNNLRFYLDDFFFDYSLYNTVFLRAGKFTLNWGISRSYGFTNLLSRIPASKYSNDPFILKMDIPLGIGGIQLLTLTRANLLGNVTPVREDFAYGGKYNLAHTLFDLDIGAFYQEGMDLRAFLSLKTTLWNTEFYNEWLGAIDSENWNGFSGAVNLGFLKDFSVFDRKLSVGGEVFYNAENNAIWYSPETDIRGSEVYRFLEGFNLALNLLFRFGGKGNPRLFVQALYAVEQDSARLIPGFRLSPWQHVDFYFAVPMSLGSKDGYYYLHNEDPRNRPFSFAMLVTIKGSARASHY